MVPFILSLVEQLGNHQICIESTPKMQQLDSEAIIHVFTSLVMETSDIFVVVKVLRFPWMRYEI